MNTKPLGRKNYGSIPHLPNSRKGPGDHSCHLGQAKIATVQTRDKHDEVIVQEKLDGSNVGIARINDALFPLGRAGYTAISSPYKQHRMFHDWVMLPFNYMRFMSSLENGERLVGEWLAQAHGTRYNLFGKDPFVAFDMMTGDERLPYDEFLERLRGLGISTPPLLHRGHALPVIYAMGLLEQVFPGRYGSYGALEPVEGAVWRIERNKLIDRHSGERKRVVDFLVKYVRPDKVDGKYLPNVSGKNEVWNWRPE
jgi:hypothetical protein